MSGVWDDTRDDLHVQAAPWRGVEGQSLSSTCLRLGALAAVPGVIVLEILEYGRPRIRDRKGARAFAIYLILSLLVWALAMVVLGASERLAAVIDAGSGSGQRLVDSYIALSWRLTATAVALGLLLRASLFVLERLAYDIAEQKRLGQTERFPWLGRAIVGLVSMAFAWDKLLARLRRSGLPQVVHIRFRDGSETYGVFAGGGRADFQADGRGLVLDAELVEVDGRLVQIAGSNGVFVEASAIASIGLSSIPARTRMTTPLTSSHDETGGKI